MVKKIIVLLMLLSSIHAFSQELGAISGKLVQLGTKEVVPYASVALYKKDSTLLAGVSSSDKGEFRFSKIPYGEYIVKADVIGLEKKYVNVSLKGKNTAIGEVSLNPKSEVLKEVTIQGEKSTLINKVDRQVFKADAFQASQGGTATDVIRNMPSVNVNAQGEISVRGSSGFVVLIDGKPIQTSAETILNQIPANAVQDIEIITTPLAKYDSEGKGGIINIVTKKGTTDGVFFQVNGNYGLPSIEPYDNSENAKRYGGDFILGYKKGMWNLSFGASYIRKDKTGRREGRVNTTIDTTTTFFPSDGERSFDEENYSGRFGIGFQPDDQNDFNLGFFAGIREKVRTADILYDNTKVGASGNSIVSSPDGQYFNENDRTRKGDFVLGSFDYAHKFENKSKIKTSFLYEYTLLGGPTTNLNLGYANGEIQRNTVLQEEFNTNDNPLNGIRYQLDYEFKPSKYGKFEVGYQFRNLDHDGDFVYKTDGQLDSNFTSTIDLKRTIHSVYGQLTGEEGKWNYGFGLRGEYMERQLDLGSLKTPKERLNYDFVRLFPSMNLQYDLGKRWVAKAGYSKRVERTTSFKMNPFREREHSETLEQGDAELLPEFIDIIELGITKKTEKSSYFSTVYYRHVNNLINRVNKVFVNSDGEAADTILDRVYSNVGVGNSLGMELGAEVKPTKWLKIFTGANIYNQHIKGEFDGQKIDNDFWVYSINNNTTFQLCKTASVQFSLNYISERNTAQGRDSRYLSPNLTVRKTFLDDRLVASVQWLNVDMGLLPTNEQRITTRGTDSNGNNFFTTTNYVYEVDMIMLNLSYTFNKKLNKTKFIKSEFGQREF